MDDVAVPLTHGGGPATRGPTGWSHTRAWSTGGQLAVVIDGSRSVPASGRRPLVVPTVLAAPGALLSTSNKPDTIETTRKLRDEVGTTWEAVARIEALWRAREHFRGDGATGMSVWWRDHADHQMAVLLCPVGPFAKTCGTTGPGEPLRYAAPPPGLFVDVRTLAG